MRLAQVQSLLAGGPGSGRHKESDSLRDQANPSVLGYPLNRQTLTPLRQPLPSLKPGKDTGSDPIWEDGKFKGWRMHPSGDLVTDPDERERRLKG